jgi:hypothetical protein
MKMSPLATMLQPSTPEKAVAAMFHTKTDKARDELQGGQRTLSQRERALLLMADGRRSLTDFSPLFSTRDEAEQALSALVQRGYLQHAPAVAAALASQPAQARRPRRCRRSSRSRPAPRSTASTASARWRPRACSCSTSASACSCAATPGSPLQMRDALREARDREAMMTIAALMLGEVEKAAGAERAESLRERIDRLLPPAEVVH